MACLGTAMLACYREPSTEVAPDVFFAAILRQRNRYEQMLVMMVMCFLVDLLGQL